MPMIWFIMLKIGYAVALVHLAILKIIMTMMKPHIL